MSEEPTGWRLGASQDPPKPERPDLPPAATGEPSTPEKPTNPLPPGYTQDPATGTVRNAEGKIVWATPGSIDAAAHGVQQDASGTFTSVNHPMIKDEIV